VDVLAEQICEIGGEAVECRPVGRGQLRRPEQWGAVPRAVGIERIAVREQELDLGIKFNKNRTRKIVVDVEPEDAAVAHGFPRTNPMM
jgi:hypothetical protein